VAEERGRTLASLPPDAAGSAVYEDLEDAALAAIRARIR
jgi:hypothetical protein